MRIVAGPSRAVLSLSLAAAVLLSACSSERSAGLPELAGLVEKVSPSVVNISAMPAEPEQVASQSGSDGRPVPDWLKKFLDEHGNQAPGKGADGAAPGSTPDDGRSDFPVVNSSHRQRSRMVAKLVLTPPKAIEPVVLKLRAFLRRNRFPMIEALKAQFRTGHRRQTLPPALRQEMAAYFADDIRLLESLLGWDLSDWLDEARIDHKQAVAA